MNKYVKVSEQGYPVIKLYGDLNYTDLVLVVFQRPGCGLGEYNWGWAYDVKTGCWGQGHYDYRTLEDAIESLKSKYPNVIEIVDYDEKKGYIVDKENLSIQAKQIIARKLEEEVEDYFAEITSLGNECAYTDRILERVKYLSNLLTDQPTVG